MENKEEKMKKRIFLSIILAAVMLSTMLAGCSSGGSAAPKEEPAATEAEAEDAVEKTGTADEENTGLANPWTDVGSAEEAAKGAGIGSFVIAEDPVIDLGENFERTYRCMDGIAEARLEYPASALTVRKGTNAEDGDISGDYTDYSETWTQDVDGIEVTCFGNWEGDASKSIWNVDGMYYSIVAEGLGGDDDFGLNAERLTEMVRCIQ